MGHHSPSINRLLSLKLQHDHFQTRKPLFYDRDIGREGTKEHGPCRWVFPTMRFSWVADEEAVSETSEQEDVKNIWVQYKRM